MPTLPELQAGFARAVFEDAAPDAGRLFRPGRLSAENRLAVYRNNHLHNLTEALRDLYPVILRLTGEDWFAQAARGHIRSHASRSGDLNDYGREFADYLGGLRGVAESLPYLPDVARLEWLVHEAFHAADAGLLDLRRLAGVPEQAYGQLRFHLHPSCRLLQSDYPVQRIWQVNQPDHAGEETVNLEEGGAAVLVYRGQDHRVAVEALDPAAFHVVSALHRQQALAVITASLPAAADIGALLQGLVARGIVTGFSREGGAP